MVKNLSLFVFNNLKSHLLHIVWKAPFFKAQDRFLTFHCISLIYYILLHFIKFIILYRFHKSKEGKNKLACEVQNVNVKTFSVYGNYGQLQFNIILPKPQDVISFQGRSYVHKPYLAVPHQNKTYKNNFLMRVGSQNQKFGCIFGLKVIIFTK